MDKTEKLHAQIHKITELSNILTNLLSDRSLCDTEITCELFFRYVDSVQDHLKKTDADLYAELLDHSDAHKNKIANLFISGSKEIKRIFGAYTKKWCNLSKQELHIKKYDQFYAETIEMFELVLNRLQDETERLYPLIGNYGSHQENSQVH
ncbi:MAG: hypothetical protein HKP55_09445 [Gammaproteobacteria bacterium]|nr:hypothetical protein [Gammaproteobacteria bacterium]